MATHTNRRHGEAVELLERYGVSTAHACLAQAEAQPGQELPALSVKPGTAVWVYFSDHPHQAIGGTFTINACQAHDDSAGCCDTCGHWATPDAANVARQAASYADPA